jgi:hypothetical protein
MIPDSSCIVCATLAHYSLAAAVSLLFEFSSSHTLVVIMYVRYALNTKTAAFSTYTIHYKVEAVERILNQHLMR